MITVESRLLEELHDCAVQLRQLAYTLQNGVGEHDVLQLSERMRAAADELVRSERQCRSMPGDVDGRASSTKSAPFSPGGPSA